jgi:uncharacterized protein (TIGR02246 family)
MRIRAIMWLLLPPDPAIYIIGLCYGVRAGMPSDPAEIVDAQIRAYEAGDTEGFVTLYAEDAICAALPSGRVIAHGREDIRRVWGALFARSAREVTIARRMIEGRYVIDAERVRILATGQQVEATAIYLVGETLIERVWFLDPPAQPAGLAP